MRLFKSFLFFLCLVSVSFQLNAQGGGKKSNSITRFFKKTPWTFNLGGHVVDDDGNPFNNLFNVGDSWNFLPYPSRIAIDGYVKKGWSIQGEFAYTKFTAGKTIQNEVIKGDYTFFSADVHVKYDLNEVIGDTHWFDPYLTAGYGYTNRNVVRNNGFILNPNTATANAGLGFNIWVYQNLGFNVQSIAKFAMQEGTSNYLHHSVGVIYRFEYGMGNRPGKLGKRYTFLKTTK